MALGTSMALQWGFSGGDLTIPMMVLIRFSLTLSWIIAIFWMVVIISPMHVASKSLKVDSLRVWAILAISSLSSFSFSWPHSNLVKFFSLYLSSLRLFSLYNSHGGRLEVPILFRCKALWTRSPTFSFALLSFLFISLIHGHFLLFFVSPFLLFIHLLGGSSIGSCKRCNMEEALEKGCGPPL